MEAMSSDLLFNDMAQQISKQALQIEELKYRISMLSSTSDAVPDACLREELDELFCEVLDAVRRMLRSPKTGNLKQFSFHKNDESSRLQDMMPLCGDASDVQYQVLSLVCLIGIEIEQHHKTWNYFGVNQREWAKVGIEDPKPSCSFAHVEYKLGTRECRTCWPQVAFADLEGRHYHRLRHAPFISSDEKANRGCQQSWTEV
ncbi:hypothetical protein BDZ85DRAFT_255706 [Elsinoe ampelina]|uniref:Uncharacterized protein n=1 Tax=Elsinoe ampelina TaxID=302913 RepID=A0A6A6GRG4_9PEZI|nr:hypothetical protein BDZ85DRAFT_255706 [Elsinoe ampelina]